MAETILNQALKLVARGIHVVPLVPKTKKPLGKEWQKNALIKPEHVKTFFTNQPHCGLGIFIGRDSGIVGIDFEPIEGTLEDYYEKFPKTWAVRSRGGWHLYYKFPSRPILDGKKLMPSAPGRSAAWNQAQAVLYTGESSRQFVAPNTTIIPVDKKDPSITYPPFTYGWVPGCAPWEIEIAECPDWFFDETEDEKKQRELKEQRSAARTSAPGPGRKQYFDNERHAMFTATGVAMRKQGYDFTQVEEHLLKRNAQDCSPPKPEAEAEIHRICEWIFTEVSQDPLAIAKRYEEEARRRERQERIERSTRRAQVLDSPPPAMGEESNTRRDGDPGQVDNVAGQERETENVPAGPKTADKPEGLKKKGRPKKEPPYLIAQEFLATQDYVKEGEHSLRYFNQDFYFFDGKKYQVLSGDGMRDIVNRWLVGDGRRIELAGTKNLGEILNCLKMKPIYIPEHHEMPVWCEEEAIEPAGHLISLENGLFDVKHFAETGEVKMWPHTPKFVSTCALPFAYDPNAKCPTYERVVKATFGDEQKEQLWAEILGIHLFQPFTLEYFFMLQGEGANGKSVLLTVLRSLLGGQNCSSVPIDKFSKFAFHATVGKLANIVSDQQEFEKIDEGMVKQFVTREPMNVERKFKDAVTVRPTAFLTIATNHMPNFADKSDGIWRRLILFQLRNQVPDGERDARLITEAFWARSGELSGVFNLALEGLKRVVARGDLLRIPSMTIEMSKYRSDLNPIGQFAAEAIEFDPSHKATASEVYAAYCGMMHRNGLRAMGNTKFIRQLEIECSRLQQVRVSFSDKNVRLDNYSGRVWFGFRLNFHGQQLKLTPQE